MKKVYIEKLWDWLIKNYPEKTDARKIFDYVVRLNNATILDYMAEMHDKYDKELLLRPDSSLSDDFAFAVAIGKEIKGIFSSNKINER